MKSMATDLYNGLLNKNPYNNAFKSRLLCKVCVYTIQVNLLFECVTRSKARA